MIDIIKDQQGTWKKDNTIIAELKTGGMVYNILEPKMGGILLKEENHIVFLELKKQKGFTLRQLQEFVGGSIDIQPIPNTDYVFVVNDNAYGEDLPYNLNASMLWRDAYPITEYPLNNTEELRGNVLITHSSLIK